tara:strand:- start:526 stop:1446 length:921 start_codon:yes stop_codon:yes gene_type:complete
MKYSIEDFNDFETDGFIYILPKETMMLINKLSEMVGAPTYQKTPIFSRNNNIKKRNKNDNKINDNFNNDWNAIRNFKTTQIKKGENKNINEVRVLLNKLTNNNYDKIKGEIITIIEDNQDNQDNLTELCNFIFDIASTNKFYSELYAELYYHLLTSYKILENIFRNSFNQYIKLFDNIETCSPTQDYDLFCRINKTNEKRRAMSLFIVNLMKKNIITSEQVIDIVIHLQNVIESDLNNENEKVKIEELCENIFLIYTNGHNQIKIVPLFDDLFKRIANITTLDIKEHKGLSNKVKFKYMDIVEFKG